MDKKIESIKNCELCDNKPCLIGCPLDNDIPKFINALAEEKVELAYDVLYETTVLSSLCGRICPHFKQCEGSCIKRNTKNKVRIGKLEAFVGDKALESDWQFIVPKKTNYNVAVIGSGPASLTCAAFLRKKGINVTIYEKHDYLGGLLVHGIPEFRLPKKIVKKAVDNIINMGIDVQYKQELGKDFQLERLSKKYDAVFIGIGANVPNKMHIPGENLKGVYGGNELLEKQKKIDFQDKVVIVCGGGNVAMDVARTIKRLGAKVVRIVYRRGEKEMSADLKEIKAAQNDGIEFVFNTEIIKVLGEKSVDGVLTTNNDKESEMLCDFVITAIGSHSAKLVKKLGLELSDKGKIVIDKNGKTSKSKIFSGGDVAGVKSTVAWAARSGRNAAYAIIDFLNNKKRSI